MRKQELIEGGREALELKSGNDGLSENKNLEILTMSVEEWQNEIQNE